MSVNAVKDETSVLEVAKTFSGVADLLRVDLKDSGLAYSLDDCLVLVEELQTLTDLVNSDTTVSLKVIEAFSEKCEQIQTLFERIDQIEEFVERVRSSIKRLESEVSVAEQRINSKK
jgi:hypothetical protein